MQATSAPLALEQHDPLCLYLQPVVHTHGVKCLQEPPALYLHHTALRCGRVLTNKVQVPPFD